jgi:hypothetical protein
MSYIDFKVEVMVGPAGTLIFDDRGELYGATAYGGAYDRHNRFLRRRHHVMGAQTGATSRL